VAGKVLPCGCLVGVYETYGGAVVYTLDAIGSSCHNPTHQLHESYSLESDGPIPAPPSSHPDTPGRA
jgi:hypothetical protein